jgi:glyoxylase-like metal-dependent hydrolase (beta-lactamase superfamily II)
MKLTADIHRITVPTPWPVGPVNLYLLEGRRGLTLIDTGPESPEALAALDAGLAEIGKRIEDISQVVLTHFHVDHSGMCNRIVQRSGAKVYAHPLTAIIMKRDEAINASRADFFKTVYREMGADDTMAALAFQQLEEYDKNMEACDVDVELHEGDVIPGHEEFRVVYTPGHSQDHISLYRESDGVMILGDHLILHVSSNAFIEPPVRPGEPRPKTLITYREALRKLQDLDMTIGHTGHGEPITGHRELITQRLLDQERRAAKVIEQVRGGKHTGLDICLELFPRHQNQMPLIMSETLGHLDWLVAEGRLRTEETADGVLHYHIA